MLRPCKCPKCSTGCAVTDEERFHALSEILNRRQLCPCKPRPKIFKETGYRFVEFNNASIQECTRDEECGCDLCPPPCPPISIKTCLKKKKSCRGVTTICSAVSVKVSSADQSRCTLTPCKPSVEFKSAPCSAIELPEKTIQSCSEKKRVAKHKKTQKDVNINLQLNMPRETKTRCKSGRQCKCMAKTKTPKEATKPKLCVCGKEPPKRRCEASKPIIICNRPPEPKARTLLQRVKSIISHEKARKMPPVDKTECKCPLISKHKEAKSECACSHQPKERSALLIPHRGHVITQCKAYLPCKPSPTDSAEKSCSCPKTPHQPLRPKDTAVKYCPDVSNCPKKREAPHRCVCHQTDCKYQTNNIGKNKLMICPNAHGDIEEQQETTCKSGRIIACACPKPSTNCKCLSEHKNHQPITHDRVKANDLKQKREAKRHKWKQDKQSAYNGESASENVNYTSRENRSSFRPGINQPRFYHKNSSMSTGKDWNSRHSNRDSTSTANSAKNETKQNFANKYQQQPQGRGGDKVDSEGYSTSSEVSSREHPKRIHENHSLSIIYSEHDKESASQVIKPQNIRFVSIEYFKPLRHRVCQLKSGLYQPKYPASIVNLVRIEEDDQQKSVGKCFIGVYFMTFHMYAVICIPYIGLVLVFVCLYQNNIHFIY